MSIASPNYKEDHDHRMEAQRRHDLRWLRIADAIALAGYAAFFLLCIGVAFFSEHVPNWAGIPVFIWFLLSLAWMNWGTKGRQNTNPLR